MRLINFLKWIIVSDTIFSGISVTRFCEISPLMQKFTSLWQILTVYFVFYKILRLLWHICDIIRLIFNAANGQTLKNDLAIWSHCPEFCIISRKSRWCYVYLGTKACENGNKKFTQKMINISSTFSQSLSSYLLQKILFQKILQFRKTVFLPSSFPQC